MVTANIIQIDLPPLHRGRDGTGGQVAIFNHPARFKVVVCGRRWGKTTLGVVLCLRTGLQSGRAWWVAPTYPVANIGWRLLKSLAAQIPGAETHEADRYVSLPGGGEVWVKSADNPDSLRGEGLDGCVLDEFRNIKEEAWLEALRPALSDHKGWALFIGTPKGKNWVWRLFGRHKYDKNWASWQKPTIDNPFIDPSEVEAARLELPGHVFAQEYEADFGASQLQVYSDFDRIGHMWKHRLPAFNHFFGGLDFAGDTIGAHKSAGVLSGIFGSFNALLVLGEFKQSGPNVTERQLMWVAETEQKLRLLQTTLGQRHSPFSWRADKTQTAFIQLAQTMGFNIFKTKGGAESVANGVGLVQRRLVFRPDSFARIYYLAPELSAYYGLEPITYLPEDMELYRYPEMRDKDEVQSKNPLKVNDDLMDALRYMVEGADQYAIGDPAELYKNQLEVIRVPVGRTAADNVLEGLR